MSREYDIISLLWWMMTLLKSGRVYIDVGLVIFRILVRSEWMKDYRGSGRGITNRTHQTSPAGWCRYQSPTR